MAIEIVDKIPLKMVIFHFYVSSPCWENPKWPCWESDVPKLSKVWDFWGALVPVIFIRSLRPRRVALPVDPEATSGQISVFQVPKCTFKQLGVSENVVYPIVPNGFADHYPYEKWLFHWEYTQHFQTNPIKNNK